MNKLTLLILLVTAAVLAACAGGTSSEQGAQQTGESAGVFMDTDAYALDAFDSATMGEPSAASTDASEKSVTTIEAQGEAERKVIANASLSLEVAAVQQAIANIRAIATGLGGFVEQLHSSGGDRGQSASMVVRVPEAQFSPALDRITAVGELLSQSVGSQDVTEQSIDLEARLKSALRQEQSLLNLLSRAASVADVLSIERELTRVRSDIERLQGQQAFLNRQVEMATINVNLSVPFVATEPPSASLTVEVGAVGERVDEVKRLVASLDGTVDRVFLSFWDGREHADMTVRVFASDFVRVLAGIEAAGALVSKEVSEGSEAGDASAEEPNAPIRVTYVQGTASRVWLYIVAGAAGAAILAGALAALLIWRRGPRPGTARGPESRGPRGHPGIQKRSEEGPTLLGTFFCLL